jgi:hypothetical protein
MTPDNSTDASRPPGFAAHEAFAILEKLQFMDMQDNGVMMQIPRMTLFCVIAQMQLALRHPRNDGPSREQAEKFIEQSLAAFPEEARELIRRGSNPAHDVPGPFWFCESCDKRIPESSPEGYLHKDGYYYCSQTCAEERDANR